MSLSKTGTKPKQRRLLELLIVLSVVAGLALSLAPSRPKEPETLTENQIRARELMDQANATGAKFARVAPAAAGVAMSAVSGAGPFELMRKMAPLEIEELNDQLADDPENTDLLRERARLYEYVGDYEAALSDVERVQRLSYESADLLLQRARLLAHLGRYSEALVVNRAASALEPGLKSQAQLADIYIGLERYQESLDVYQEIHSEEFQDAPELWGQGAAYRGLGDEAKAQTHFQQARALTPNYCHHWKSSFDPGQHEGPHYVSTPFDNF